MAEIIWTAESESWLEEIFSYIAQDSAAAAHRVVTAIYEKVRLLEDYPRLGYIYRIEKDGDIRVLIYGHYRIAYLLKSDDSVTILGIFHGAMEINRYL